MLKPVEGYWEPVLQALAHWVAYKKQYYSGHLLTEGAIVAELTQLLSAKISDGCRMECERMYKDIHSLCPKGDRLADIVIGNKGMAKNPLKPSNITDVIEVKRHDGSSGLSNVIKDTDKLNDLRAGRKDIRLWQVVVGQRRVQRWAFNKNLNVYTRNVYSGAKGLDLRPRRGKKAFCTKAKSNNGVFVVLAEVI